MRYTILNRAALEKRAQRTDDPRHRYYVALLSATSFDDYVEAIQGDTPVFPSTYGRGRVPISPLREYLYARDDRRWIEEVEQAKEDQRTESDYRDAFARELAEALKRTSADRRKRLVSAPKKARRITVTKTVFQRSADVVADVLVRAAGRCEGCRLAAPFRRQSDGSPYLEVHHIIQLADDGDDSVENAIALCPNCHRHRHYGQAATED